MNTNQETKENTAARSTFASACIARCRKLVAQIEKTKDAILGEFKQRFAGSEHLFRLALNEAEALSWQTEFPQLVFPSLALEKAQAVAAWQARQSSLAHLSAARDAQVVG